MPWAVCFEVSAGNCQRMLQFPAHFGRQHGALFLGILQPVRRAETPIVLLCSAHDHDRQRRSAVLVPPAY